MKTSLNDLIDPKSYTYKNWHEKIVPPVAAIVLSPKPRPPQSIQIETGGFCTYKTCSTDSVPHHLKSTKFHVPAAAAGNKRETFSAKKRQSIFAAIKREKFCEPQQTTPAY